MRFATHPLLRLGLLLLLATLAGCAGMASRPTPAEQSAAAHAAALQDQGRFRDAAQAWQALAAANRGRRDVYLMHAAESYRQLGDWHDAEPLLDRIRRGHLQPDDAIQVDLLRAEDALERHDAARAQQLTADAGTLPPRWRPRAMELRARALAALDQPMAAARVRLAMDAGLSGYDRSQNQQQLLSLLEHMDVNRLQDAAAQLSAHDPMRAWIEQALQHKGSALAATMPELERPVGTLPPQGGDQAAAEGYRAPHSVTLLLPTSGPLQAAGQAVEDGFRTAWARHPERSASMQLNVQDSLGTPSGALQAYQQAVAQGADLVVGPLAPGAVAALFQQAPLPVPLLALNHPDQGLPPDGSAEFALPPEAEGAQVAARMRSQGLTEAVLFLADERWAERAAGAFKAQFRGGGGQVTGSATLARSEVNYADAINALMANAGPDTGVFIAMRPEQGRLLVPQLRIARVKQPLFATSHIYGVEDNPGLDRDLDGVVFCDAPWLLNAQPGLPRRESLADSDPNAQGPAARLFAFGMDAYALMPYLGWLRNHPGSYLSGATGQLTMDNFGRVQRTPIWARFVNGIAVPVTGSLDAEDGSSAD